MSAKIITVAQQKGGAGKTTLAAQLAVTWAKRKLHVALADVDPQASLAAWHGARRQRLGQDAGGLHLSIVAGWRLSGELDRLKQDFDVILIDSPPHAETDARIAVRAADLVLVPIQPSPMDLWATGPTLELARKEKSPFLMVLNRVPPKGRVVDIIKGKMTEMELPVATCALGNRLAFAASMLDGLGVMETEKSSTAAKEIAALADELASRVKIARSRK